MRPGTHLISVPLCQRPAPPSGKCQVIIIIKTEVPAASQCIKTLQLATLTMYLIANVINYCRFVVSFCD